MLEAGTGAGAALLCLTARVPGVYATGVEMDAAMAELAAANAEANGFSGIGVVTDRIEIGCVAAIVRSRDRESALPSAWRSGVA